MVKMSEIGFPVDVEAHRWTAELLFTRVLPGPWLVMMDTVADSAVVG